MVERFTGISSLYGEEGLEILQKSAVTIIGVGGVGSWAVEALARSGIGRFNLVDLDEVCVSNMNRQIQALSSTIGRSKATVLKDRIIDINPICDVHVVEKFFSTATQDLVFDLKHEVLIDCIDRITNKSLLIAGAKERNLPIIVTGSAGERMDPTKIKVADLAFTEHDPMLAMVRKKLRIKHNFPRRLTDKFGIKAIYYPYFEHLDLRPSAQKPENKVCVRASCNAGLGSNAFVAGSFGFIAAAECVKMLLEQRNYFE